MKAKGLREEEIRTAVKERNKDGAKDRWEGINTKSLDDFWLSYSEKRKEKKPKRVTVYAGAMRLLAFLATYGPSASGEGRSGGG
uniref:Uncharacterized protein n=1 Tax=Trichogramma kaykai TaxID=54128 RepID=A0ABD2W792_9HYME